MGLGTIASSPISRGIYGRGSMGLVADGPVGPGQFFSGLLRYLYSDK